MIVRLSAFSFLVFALLLPRGPFHFEEVAAQVGIHHRTVFGGERANRYLIETTGCGAAWFDYDRDGWLDAFLVNGSRLEGVPGRRPPAPHLYHNRGDGTFEDVTSKAGLGRSGWGQGVCVGDVDNDGFEDLFLTYWGQNVLYRNQGDGTFRDVTRGAGLLQERKRWNTGCAFLDYDRDGDLDLFVANYIDFDPDKVPDRDSGLCLYKGLAVACGPLGLPGGRNLLYRNRGDGTFTEVSRRAGILETPGTYGLGVLTLDYDQDGWTDIYVADDSSPSVLYHNRRDGTFQDVAITAGVGYSANGKPQAGMGVAAGDYDRDGRLDIFKTNFSDDTPNLYHNLGSGLFEDLSRSRGLGANRSFLGWGCALVDLDNDGWLDIFQVNGHIYPEIEALGLHYRQRKAVYRNRRGRFRDVTRSAGSSLLEPRAGRGAAFGDFDNDGDLDVLVNNVNQRADLYRNDSEGGHWVAIRALGRRTNRSGIGARIEVRAGALDLLQEVRSGGSYISQNPLRVHFGLGGAEQLDRLEIEWPSGRRDRYRRLPVDRVLYALEGVGILPGRGAPPLERPEEGEKKD